MPLAIILMVDGSQQVRRQRLQGLWMRKFEAANQCRAIDAGWGRSARFEFGGARSGKHR